MVVSETIMPVRDELAVRLRTALEAGHEGPVVTRPYPWEASNDAARIEMGTMMLFVGPEADAQLELPDAAFKVHVLCREMRREVAYDAAPAIAERVQRVAHGLAGERRARAEVRWTMLQTTDAHEMIPGHLVHVDFAVRWRWMAGVEL